jgi:hypothetical protein
VSAPGFSEKQGAILGAWFYRTTKMKSDELSFLREKGRSEEEIKKLRIILAFLESLPSENLQDELLCLMEDQPSMRSGEFDLRLAGFVSRIIAAADSAAASPGYFYGKPTRLQ